MKKIRMVFILLFVCSCLLVQGCSKKGEQGDKGIDGREVILQVEDGYIKWQYEGETTWKNLISLTSLTGVAGKDGTSISNITIDKDNNLLIILSNGETKNLGNINGIDGINGQDGREVTFKVENDYIKWQYVGDTTWTNLIELSSLIGPKGDKGNDGIDGHEVTFKVENDYIKWQYVGDTTWTNLIELSSLIGPKGDKGTDGIDGREVIFKVENGYIKWQYEGDTTWTNLIELSSLIGPKGDKGTDGIDGREVTFKVESGYIKWQYVGDTTWTNLIELSSLIGPKGDKGNDGTDGREVTFKVESGYIKWQYVGDTTWINLIELSSLIGPKGDKGNDGQDGKDGKSAYEIYKETHPEYTKSEEEWLDDLVNGRLGTKEETKYTVKFVTNTTDTIADQIVTKGEKVTKPTDPVKEGYIFDGWYIDDEKWVFSGYTITSDITLTARFIKKEVESFSLNNSIKENDIYKVVVSNSINSYNFRLNINITGYSNYYVSGDEYGSTIYFTKQVQLNEGNNYYYILCEKDNGDIDTYKVNIYRNHLYKVEFNTNTTSTIEPKQVEEGTILTDIEVLTKIGYTFKGWDYDFTKPITSNLIVNAIWEANKYTITYDTNGGIINRDAQQVTYDSNYILLEPTYEGHAFMGWYYNDRLFDNTGIWNLTANITLTANWSAEFNIIYILDGGTNDSNNPTKYYYTTETINLKDPTKVEAIFDGWYTEPKFINKVEQIEKGSTGDITLYAKFIMNKYTLTFETNGGTSIEQVTADYGTLVSIENPTKEEYIFDGWYKDETFTTKYIITTMPNENITLYAKFVEYMKPYEANGLKYIYFGEYPQTLKVDSVTITSNTPDSNGYYLGSDGERYAMVITQLHTSTIQYFNNKQQIVKGTTYYFKVEPIKWKILQVNGTEYKLVTDLIIDNQKFHSSTSTRTIDGKTIYPNNYEYSDIRKWLNEDFYNKAFTKVLQSYINTTLVDNSKNSIGFSNDTYTCNDTYDKVYLLSYKDITNTEYGFIDYTSREKQLTDYAKAKGCYMNTNDSYYNNGNYWLRSPNYDYDYCARYVYYIGYISGNCVNYGPVGVSSAITISLS